MVVAKERYFRAAAPFGFWKIIMLTLIHRTCTHLHILVFNDSSGVVARIQNICFGRKVDGYFSSSETIWDKKKPVLPARCRNWLHRRTRLPKTPHFLNNDSTWKQKQNVWKAVQSQELNFISIKRMMTPPWQPSLSSNHCRAKQSLDTCNVCIICNMCQICNTGNICNTWNISNVYNNCIIWNICNLCSISMYNGNIYNIQQICNTLSGFLNSGFAILEANRKDQELYCNNQRMKST